MVRLLPLCLLLALLSCKSGLEAKDAAALIVSPTPSGQRELVAVVASAIGRDTVLLADDALVTSSELIIERAQIKRIDGRVGGGREFTRPDHFKLVLSGSKCFLIHQANQARYELSESRCVLQ